MAKPRATLPLLRTAQICWRNEILLSWCAGCVTRLKHAATAQGARWGFTSTRTLRHPDEQSGWTKQHETERIGLRQSTTG